MSRRLDWSKNTAHKIALEAEREERLQKQLDYYDEKDYYKRLKSGEIEKPVLRYGLTPYDKTILEKTNEPKQYNRPKGVKKKQYPKRDCETTKSKAGKIWTVDEFGCEIIK